jgi:putative flavoprotein involved in K+ transport
MRHSTPQIFDIIIVGAGHAGLSISYFLCKNNLAHMVFERGQIGESWRSQRWDSFALNTPNFMNILTGETYQDLHPERFLLRDQVITKLKNYVEKFQLPVREYSAVTAVTKKSGEKYFSVNVRYTDQSQQWISKQVVIASGAMSAANIPAFSKSLSKNIYQVHVADYRNQSQLPEGGVLIVGGGQSGCQVAEDFVASGRKIYLSTSKVGRMPRRYRGKDVLDWLTEMKYYDIPRDIITDPQQLTITTPLLSGIGVFGHTISLQSLHKQGVIILGRLNNIENDTINFASDAADNIRSGDEFSQAIKTLINDFISKEGYVADEMKEDEADQPDVNASCAEDISTINCREKQIYSVIWTTGFTSDFSYIKLPVLTDDGKPIHHNGISPVNGLFFIGFPWLRSHKSGIIYGISEDAEFISREILKNHLGKFE